MKRKTLGFLTAFLTVPFIILSLQELLTETASAQKQTTQTKTVQAVLPKSKRINKIIKGSENPREIPDNVAYELFLRTVAKGNARNLVERAGFDEQTTEYIMSEAYSLNESLENLDRRAFDIKSGKAKVSNADSELVNLEKTKDDFISRTVNRFIPQRLNEEKTDKLCDFIQTEVKRNIQKAFLNETPKADNLALSKYFTNAFAEKATGNGGQLYLYSAAWSDDFAVYGSGSISEQYSSSTSYLVTVTVTSPTGRSNTTVSDWSYATLVHNTGLSIGVEDGTYNVQAAFDEQDGNYDEYGNFYGTGSSYVGSSTSSTFLLPLVGVRSINANQELKQRSNSATANFP